MLDEGNGLEAVAQKIALPGLDIEQIAAFPGNRYPIYYGDHTRPEGACAVLERGFRSRQFYEAKPQSLQLIRSSCILDLKFGSPLIHDGIQFRPIDGAFYSPYLPGKNQYIDEINKTIPIALGRGNVHNIDNEYSEELIKFSLLGRWSNVYFHMLSESLTQINTIKKFFKNRRAVAIVPKDTTPIQNIARKTSTEFGFSELESGHRYVLARNVAFYTGFYQHASINSEFIETTAALKANAVNGDRQSMGTDRRLYISRLAARARPLENEEEVARIASSLGYEVVDPGRLSFRDQIRLFSGASIVAGPHGAGLANAAFCQPGATMIELRPQNRPGQSPMLNETYRKIAAAANLSYNFCIFENERNSERWSVDAERVAQTLRAAREGQENPRTALA